MIETPRVLIISNESISNSSSNGRTLRNFLIGWPKECIAQFYIQNSMPDYEVCDNYFRVSDKKALKAFFGMKIKKIPQDTIKNEKTNPNLRTPKGRNALTMMAREIVWNSNRWKNSGFDEWVESFKPDVILLQAGDSGFAFRLAENLSDKYSLPLVIYNSENFYFKNYDYFRAKGLAHWFYPVFRRHFCKQLKETVEKVQKSIYICDMLQNDYDCEFHKPSVSIYTATEMKRLEAVNSHQAFVVSYLGNLGVGRHEPLIDIATALHSISSDYYLDIYGKMPDEDTKNAMLSCPGIRYKGFVSYDEVRRVMGESDVLVHAENFNAFFREGLKRAFSTKIADTLASGTCFLLYAPEEIACAQYLKKNEAAYVVSNKEELVSILYQLAESPNNRDKYVEKAGALVAKNHSVKKNAELFQTVLIEAVEDYNNRIDK